MKLLQLILWVGQFGFSILFPLLVFLMLAFWLRLRFDLGLWIVALLGFIGSMTSFSTAKSCLRSMQKAADEASSEKPVPLSFNDHM